MAGAPSLAARAACRGGAGLVRVVVLKGAGTVVCDSSRLYVNKTGNPGMATGGTGDVLAGLIGALMGLRLSDFDAASLGTHLHGQAGDRAARRLGIWSMLAGDLLDELPNAFKAYAKLSGNRTRLEAKK